MTRSDLAKTFLNSGADYDRFRPGFPAEVASYCLPERVHDALDLGAGTGKFTEQLASRAEHLTAVDPSALMLAQLSRKLPSVTVLEGTAESLPLRDASQDAVTVAQAFHWFDRDAASREIARVLRPGGTLALVWNSPDPSCTWDSECQLVAHPDQGALTPEDVDAAPELDPLPGFDEMRSAWIPWSEHISRDHYLRRWLTVSTFMAATDDERREMLARLERILDESPDTAGQTTLSLQHLTMALVYRKAAEARRAA